MVVFRPTKSDIFPENGREIPAEIVKRVITNPLIFSPPSMVIKPFNSGIIRLKLVMKKNMESDMIQKFEP